VVPDHDARVGRDLCHTLEHETAPLPRIAQEHDLTGSWRAALRDDEEPIPLPQRRFHAVAGDGHAPGTHRYFFVAQNVSLISFTAAWRSAAACASTLCLFFEASFKAFQNMSCSFGYFSRCSGLK
jgi:hypothetical protein